MNYGNKPLHMGIGDDNVFINRKDNFKDNNEPG